MRRAILYAAALPATILAVLLVVLPLVYVAFAHASSPASFAVFTAVALCLGLGWSRKDWAELYELAAESRDWAKGAAGERLAASDLALLPDEYLVLNDVHAAFRGRAVKWNWDHVIIGPAGLFVVDAKYYSATRIRDGKRDARTQRNVRQVHGYAFEFKKELVRLNGDLQSVFVVPMLAYVNEGTWVQSLREGDVHVLPLRLVRSDILTHSSGSLPATEAIKIANALFMMYEPHLQEAYREQYRSWGHTVRESKWMNRAEAAHSVATPDSEKMICPICGAPMRLQSGAFFGCSRYPETGCRGKRALDGSVK